MLSFLSAFLMAMSMTAVFSGTALAADCTVTPLTDAQFGVCVGLATGVGDIITVPAGTLTLTTGRTITNASIYLEAGSTLTGTPTGSVTLTFMGSYNATNTMKAPIVTWATTAPVTISGLKIIDGSTGPAPVPNLAGSATILSAAVVAATTIENCNITCNTTKKWAIESGNIESTYTINKTTFESCHYGVNYDEFGPLYLPGMPGAALVLTGNTFIKSGINTIDSEFFQSGSTTISGNEFDPSDNWPAFDIGNLAWGHSTYSATPSDFNSVVNGNDFYPIIVREFATTNLYNGSNTSPLSGNGFSVSYKLDSNLFDPSGNPKVVLKYGSVDDLLAPHIIGADTDCAYQSAHSSTDNRECVLPGTLLLQKQFPVIESMSGYSSCSWFRESNDGIVPGSLTDPITQGESFILKCTPQQTSGGSISVPTTGSFALVILGLLLAGLAAVGLRNRYQ
jgi:hypothetical protein